MREEDDRTPEQMMMKQTSKEKREGEEDEDDEVDDEEAIFFDGQGTSKNKQQKSIKKHVSMSLSVQRSSKQVAKNVQRRMHPRETASWTRLSAAFVSPTPKKREGHMRAATRDEVARQRRRESKGERERDRGWR